MCKMSNKMKNIKNVEPFNDLKFYEAPVCEVVELQTEGGLLVGSESVSGVNDDFNETDYSESIWY